VAIALAKPRPTVSGITGFRLPKFASRARPERDPDLLPTVVERISWRTLIFATMAQRFLRISADAERSRAEILSTERFLRTAKMPFLISTKSFSVLPTATRCNLEETPRSLRPPRQRRQSREDRRQDPRFTVENASVKQLAERTVAKRFRDFGVKSHA